MKVAAVVQARLGSTRLPRKALLDLNGAPLIGRVFQQLRLSRYISECWLTTSDRPEDDELAAWATSQDVRVLRHTVDDIIGRYSGVVRHSGAQNVLRIWGDCPFVCGDVLDRMVDEMHNQGLRFLTNADIRGRTYPAGLDAELYEANLLREMDERVVQPGLREFPIEYVRTHLSDSEWGVLQTAPDWSHIHLTVDYAQDLDATARILQECFSNRPFGYSELQQAFDAHLDLFQRFSHQPRNIEYRKFIGGSADDH